jgi:ribosomal protein L12E/L44/L45/RPP1/RPP2
MPSLMAKGAELGSQRVQTAMPELQNAMMEEAKKQQGTTDAGAAAPGAAPAASPAAKETPKPKK